MQEQKVKKIWIYDIECILSFFSIVAWDKDAKEKRQFYIHESKDQRNEIIDFLQNECKGMVGFNNLNYDYPLLHFFMNTFYEYDTTKNLLLALYNKSQEIIESSFSMIWKKDRYIPQIDLYRIHHFDNRGRRCSLKDCEMAMRMSNLQSLPIAHDAIIKEEDIPKIMGYNDNDVYATWMLYKITKGETDEPLYEGANKLELRRNIKQAYNNHYLLDDVLNFNDVKIGDTINKIVYSELTGLQWRDFKNLRTKRSEIKFSECIPDFIKFNTNKLNKLLDELKLKIITNTKGAFKKQITFGNTKYTIAQGGLHSDDPARIVKSTKDYLLIDADVSSYYPRSVLTMKLYPAHLGPEWLKGYEQTYNKRIEAKKRTKEGILFKSTSKSLKDSLNGGGYGKTNEEYNWQYDPKVMLTVTLTGQLSLLILIEKLESNSIEVISANTDGIVSKVPKDKEDKYYEICKKWEELTSYELEYSYYNQIIQTSVNDYIAEKSDGELKFKGDFEINKEIHKNHSNRIVPIAVANYFINDIPVEETVKNPQDEYKIGDKTYKGYGIFDYCGYRKAQFNQRYNFISANKDHPFMNDTVLMPKNIRYIVTNEGGILVKSYLSGKSAGTEEKVNAGYKITITNKIDNSDYKLYDLDYDFYIEECNKLIRGCEQTIPKKRKKFISKTKIPDEQLSLF